MTTGFFAPDARRRAGEAHPIHHGEARKSLEEYLFIDLASKELLGEVERPRETRRLIVHGWRGVGRARRLRLLRPGDIRESQQAAECAREDAKSGRWGHGAASGDAGNWRHYTDCGERRYLTTTISTSPSRRRMADPVLDE